MSGDPTVIARVRQVLGSRITAELIAETAPLYRGRLYQLGQVGSMVRIPHGTRQLFAAVTMVGIAELAGPPEPSGYPHMGDRWIQCQLIGQTDGLGNFSRGVVNYPALDDEVHLATPDDLAAVYPSSGGDRIRIGSHSMSKNLEATLDLRTLVMRHGLVVGSTGAGKTSSVASLLQSMASSGFANANVVLIDPHGEYSKALENHGDVLSVLETGRAALSVPYWALSFNHLLIAAGINAIAGNPRSRLQELVVDARRSFLEEAGWDQPPVEEVSADTPVPFDLRSVWHKFDYENNWTVAVIGDLTSVCEEDPGDFKQLIPAAFTPYAPGGASPFKGPNHRSYGSWPARLRQRLQDPRFEFLWRGWADPSSEDPLPALVSGWLGGSKPISVLDFSGVATESADLAIGLVLSLLFDVASSAPPEGDVGRGRPVLVVLEEAHRFVGRTVTASTSMVRGAAEKIAREGRKMGIGLMAVSQRPSELSTTILSQAGTFIALRLTNASDQGSIRAALPDSIASLADVLPSLRTGEALVSGEAVDLPSRVQIDMPNPEPDAQDPTIEGWRHEPKEPDLSEVIERIRGRITTGEA